MSGKSILQEARECWLHANLLGVPRVHGEEKHHVFGGSRRSISEKYGLWVYLTHDAHNEPPNGVHHNQKHRELLQQFAQQKAMEKYGWTTAEFIHLFGKNYLE